MLKKFGFGLLVLVQAMVFVPSLAFASTQNAAWDSQVGNVSPQGGSVVDAVATPNDGAFVQMDAGSSIVMKFPGSYVAMPDGTAAADLEINTFDAEYRADAEISVSMDGTAWVSLGIYPDTSNIDLDLEPVGPVKYVKIDQGANYIDPTYPTLGFDLNAVFAINSTEITNASVHIYKYIDGVAATVDNTGGVDFPMFTSTFGANFTLGPGGWYVPYDADYEASTSPMALGSSYSANERLDTSLVGESCDGNHAYSLTGYAVGNSLLVAQGAQLTLNAPDFTNLQTDKYVIVENHKCEEVVPPTNLKVHIYKYLNSDSDTITQLGDASGAPSFPMTATWQTANLNGGVSSSGNYVLGNNHGGATLKYAADTSPMQAPANYITSEVTGGADVVSQAVANSNLPDGCAALAGYSTTTGRTCSEITTNNASSCPVGKYRLIGYRYGDSLAEAEADYTHDATSLGAEQFTGLTADKYIIVVNQQCYVPIISTGTISGMKYNDLNRNGKKDANEPGLQGWVIRLIFDDPITDVDTLITTATTDANGNYSFTNVAPGIYDVRETHQKGWKRMSKNPKDIVITAGSEVTGVDFGNAVKKKEEKEDDSKDDDRDDQSGHYDAGHGHSDYGKDQDKKDHNGGDKKNH